MSDELRVVHLIVDKLIHEANAVASDLKPETSATHLVKAVKLLWAVMTKRAAR